jgi:hypothetical protein
VRHAFELALERALDETGAALPDDATAPSDVAGRKFQSEIGRMPGLSSPASYVSASSLAAAYQVEAKVGGEPPSPRGTAAALRRSLRPGLGAGELKRLRRRFALALHPDRVPAEFRAEASDALARANAEIDRALKCARGG